MPSSAARSRDASFCRKSADSRSTATTITNGDPLWRHSRCVPAKDPLHHLGFDGLIMRLPRMGSPFASKLFTTSYRRNCRRWISHPRPSPQPAPDLVREILEEECVHRALQPNVQMCHVAFGERDHFHVREGEAFPDVKRDSLLVSARLWGYVFRSRRSSKRDRR
jgi:hypothetical protein